ncbi:unnamed protein product [Didymodactylos carnosus]|uniref:Uncharacterized protein n=1 Tax=Didymodactylos carnosus TaxID=1234261 RepID=A0A813TQ97_9BILA|nr:unnamed protein product [Didymodactylos carnosus]CAF1353262.1 unnamed protein product [Didymodactylos carnosus]CAF3598712.1 unnamed protein product [Didymodactylos carnosus]CAF4163739.1 unnamed protein product [Didymodactylos carnosus]
MTRGKKRTPPLCGVPERLGINSAKFLSRLNDNTSIFDIFNEDIDEHRELKDIRDEATAKLDQQYLVKMDIRLSFDSLKETIQEMA